MPDMEGAGANNPGETGQSPETTREVIVLEPGDEQAQKIAKAMGSQMAADILQLLQSGPKTSTEVTETLKIPMGTAKYHIENLLGAGLIEVTKTKYSVKGREVKVYGLKDQLLIVTPRVANVRSLLLKYASLFGVMIIATAVIGAILGLFTPVGTNLPVSRNTEEIIGNTNTLPSPAFSANATGIGGGAGPGDLLEKSMVPTPVPSPVHEAVQSSVQVQVTVPVGFPLQDVLIAFFVGGCFVILVLLTWDIYQKRKISDK
jgi:DNA-binding transcriptional ArsR family regulator